MSSRQGIRNSQRERIAHSARCWLLVLVAVGVSASCSGCSRWNWRGKGFGDNSTGWTDKMRPPADEKQFSGLDARAKEIERNLGVR
jgi:hypothetical protein